MAAAITPECFATDRAVEYALAGMPFREAYRRVAAEMEALGESNAAAGLQARVSPGAPGDLRLEEIEKRLSE